MECFFLDSLAAIRDLERGHHSQLAFVMKLVDFSLVSSKVIGRVSDGQSDGSLLQKDDLSGSNLDLSTSNLDPQRLISTCRRRISTHRRLISTPQRRISTCRRPLRMYCNRICPVFVSDCHPMNMSLHLDPSINLDPSLHLDPSLN